jgi:isoleucyl-tRNA synthetase
MDRWILSRLAGLAAGVEDRLRDVDPAATARLIDAFIEDLSTWYVRLSRRRFSRNDDPADRDAAFATLHATLVGLSKVIAPILPFLADSMYGNLVSSSDEAAPDSVHLTRWPTGPLARFADPSLESAMATARRVVDLTRTLRGTAGLRVRQPLARMWLAIPDRDRGRAALEPLIDLIAEELNVKEVTLIDDDSDLVERRVKVLLPKVGKRLGSAIPAVMAAARDGATTFRDDGSVELAGQILAPDEVEVLAIPRPGTAVAHDEGLLVVIDTALTPELRAEGDARELQRAVQDLRKDAGLDLDARIELWVDGLPAGVEPHLASVARETLADRVTRGRAEGAGAATAPVDLSEGTVTIALRGLTNDGSAAA